MQGNPNDYLGNRISAVFWTIVMIGAVAVSMFVISAFLKGCRGNDLDPKQDLRMINREATEKAQSEKLAKLKLAGAERSETLANSVEWLAARKAAPTKKVVPGMEPPAAPAKEKKPAQSKEAAEPKADKASEKAAEANK